MDFGKLNSISDVNFEFGKIPDFTEFFLNKNIQDSCNIYYGGTGWSVKEWIGRYYPNGIKSKDFITYYTQQFSTIEFNTTHYRIPDKNTVLNWYEKSDSEFKFCPKVTNVISHSKNLALEKDAIIDFCNAVAHFNEKLGVCFLQLPPGFSSDYILLLKKFLEKFPSNEIPLSIEFRNENWFDKEIFEKTLELLDNHNTGVVITDVAGRRDVCHMGLSSGNLLIRFVGNNLDNSDYKRVDNWVEVMSDWMKRGLSNIYFFSHQPDPIKSPQMCTYFIEQIESKTKFRFERKITDFTNNQLKLF